MSVIADLYNGKIMPAEQMKPKLKELRERWKDINDLEENFLKTLQPPQERRYDAILDQKLEEVGLFCEQAYIDGVKFGFRLAVEALSEREEG